MKVLKKLEGKKHVFYSFETKKEAEDSQILAQTNNKILFSGTKTDLKSKGEGFWRDLVETKEMRVPGEMVGNVYRDYKSNGWFLMSRESGLSALNEKGEYCIIVEEIL